MELRVLSRDFFVCQLLALWRLIDSSSLGGISGICLVRFFCHTQTRNLSHGTHERSFWLATPVIIRFKVVATIHRFLFACLGVLDCSLHILQKLTLGSDLPDSYNGFKAYFYVFPGNLCLYSQFIYFSLLL